MLTDLITLFWTWDHIFTGVAYRGLFLEAMALRGTPHATCKSDSGDAQNSDSSGRQDEMCLR